MNDFLDFAVYRKWNRRNWFVAILALAVLFVLEWQFFFIERAIGRYLVWNNLGREQLGPQWEKANSRLAAGSRLENVAFERREAERKLGNLHTFGQVLDFMADQQQFELAPE
ncbi:MAG: hypothetical protein ACE5I1_24735, partial [bacterium]